jgi:uncharacterized protein YlxW (UPF0749 family)
MTQQDMVVDVKTEDVQEVMRNNPTMALQVQNEALRRQIRELNARIEELSSEIDQERIQQVQKGTFKGKR